MPALDGHPLTGQQAARAVSRQLREDAQPNLAPISQVAPTQATNCDSPSLLAKAI